MSKYLCYFPSCKTVKVLYFDSLYLIVKYFWNSQNHPIHVFEFDNASSSYKFLIVMEKVNE